MSSYKSELFLTFEGHLKIIEEPSGKILLDEDNAIHVQNMSRLVSKGLANEENSTIFRLAFGNNGTFRDVGGNTIYRVPNDGNNGGGWEARLYREIYSEIIDETDSDFAIDPGSAGPDNIRAGGGSFPTGDPPSGGVFTEELGKKSRITIIMSINENEPINQDPFIFDEIGLYSLGLAAIATAATTSVNVGNKLSTNDVIPDLVPNTQYGIEVDVDGFVRTEVILTPITGGSGTGGNFTYGDLLQGINDSTWWAGGDDLADYVFFYITDLTGGSYPSITGQESFGLITAQSKITGSSSAISFPETQPISGFDNVIYLLSSSQWGNVNINSVLGQDAGDKNNALSPTLERERLLSHLVFQPIRKADGTIIRIMYTITVGVVEDNPSSVLHLPPSTAEAPPPPTVTPTITPTITPAATDLGCINSFFDLGGDGNFIIEYGIEQDVSLLTIVGDENAPGNYYVGGISAGGKGYITKIQSTGCIQWSKQLNGASRVVDIISIGENLYTLTPESLNKFDSDGILIWSKEYSSAGFGNGELFGITADETFLYVGGKFGNTPMIIKLDLNGNEVWTIELTGLISNPIHTLALSPTHLYAGSIGSGTNFPFSDSSGGRIIKLDFNGNLLISGSMKGSTNAAKLNNMDFNIADDTLYIHTQNDPGISTTHYSGIMALDTNFTVLYTKIYGAVGGSGFFDGFMFTRYNDEYLIGGVAQLQAGTANAVLVTVDTSTGLLSTTRPLLEFNKQVIEIGFGTEISDNLTWHDGVYDGTTLVMVGTSNSAITDAKVGYILFNSDNKASMVSPATAESPLTEFLFLNDNIIESKGDYGGLKILAEGSTPIIDMVIGTYSINQVDPTINFTGANYPIAPGTPIPTPTGTPVVTPTSTPAF